MDKKRGQKILEILLNNKKCSKLKTNHANVDNLHIEQTNAKRLKK